MQRIRSLIPRLRSAMAWLLWRALWFALLAAGPAEASTPRWTTGPPYFTVANTPVAWYTDHPLYYTDPGDLSASVNHAGADALVSAAAGVWNVPTARIVLQQGGTLDEQVSGANVYAGSSGLVFPADVESTNYAAKQIAVIYDRDGSVTDLLLGSASSDPVECRDNAVTESVDAITPSGGIQHAVLILNGRCTGAAPEQQLQMQYQLERAFGRILGLGWSQLNDNVFTGTPQPTYAQALHWPLMHPIDVICGPYSYQCLPQPFTLRDDDVASITNLYPVTGSSPPAGKQISTANAATLDGVIAFPGQPTVGMAGVNILVRRRSVPQQILETWDDVSMVTGAYVQQTGPTPVAAKGTDAEASLGSLIFMEEKDFGFVHDTAGYFYLPWIPLPAGSSVMDMLFRTEPINPLYTGAYAVGPYPLSTVSPSGPSIAWVITGIGAAYFNFVVEVPTSGADASECTSTSSDGTSTAPASTPASGFWTDTICAIHSSPIEFDHAAWTELPVRANRSLTVEVSGVDEAGLATVNKVRPVIGVWSGSASTSGPPDLGIAAAAFNSLALGMTSVSAQSAQADILQVAISDERGDGRPDYSYNARLLYADTISPAQGSAGTPVTITGRGFRPGNTVTIGGTAAQVSSWTATTIVATIPVVKSVVPGPAVALDVTVTDLSTQGTTTMGAAFQDTYVAPVYTMQLVSAPSGTVAVGYAAAPVFAVRMIDADGVSPVAGVPVVFSLLAGAATCSGSPCTVVTDARGLASITVTPTAAGTITLQAAADQTSQTVTFQAAAVVRSASASPAVEYIAAGATVSWTVTAEFAQQGAPAASATVAWAAGTGPLTISAAQPVTDANGDVTAAITAGPLSAGADAAGSACAWTTVCAPFSAHGVAPADFTVVVEGGGGQSLPAGGSLAPVNVQVTDTLGNPVAGAVVQIHQTLSQWTAPCPQVGRCPLAPIYRTTSVAAVSDSTGTVQFAPLEMAGPEVTSVVVTSGTQGFVSLTLQKHP